MPKVILVFAALKSICDLGVTEQGQRRIKDLLDGGTAIEGAIAKVVEAVKLPAHRGRARKHVIPNAVLQA